jgi:phospholipid transport system substrate-binding protein
MNENGQWKVYDVVIEGASLISNYRSQFREILINQSPQGLLDTLKKRAAGKS